MVLGRSWLYGYVFWGNLSVPLLVIPIVCLPMELESCACHYRQTLLLWTKVSTTRLKQPFRMSSKSSWLRLITRSVSYSSPIQSNRMTASMRCLLKSNWKRGLIPSSPPKVTTSLLLLKTLILKGVPTLRWKLTWVRLSMWLVHLEMRESRSTIPRTSRRHILIILFCWVRPLHPAAWK